MADTIELKLATHSDPLPDGVARAAEIHIHYRLPAYVMAIPHGRPAPSKGGDSFLPLPNPLDNQEVERLVKAGLSQLLSEGDSQAPRQRLAPTEQQVTRSKGESDVFSARVAALTPREAEVMNLILTGKTLKQIAADLGISIQTAAKHRSKVLEKLRVANDVELLRLTFSLDAPSE